MMLLFLIFTIESTKLPNWDVFRKCDDMRFCKVNRNIQIDDWSLDYNSINITNNIFSGSILYQNKESGIILNMSQLKIGCIRIRFDLTDENESNYRYDISKLDLVIDQTIINDLAKIEMQKEGNQIIIKGINDISIIIKNDPFLITVKKGDRVISNLNVDEQLVFEHNLNIKLPDVEYGGFTESFAYGPTAVGIDIHIPDRTVRFSGMSETDMNMNIPDSTSEPYRRNAFDHYSMYGSIPFLIAHSAKTNTGVFWLNPTDTFFDIRTMSSSRKVRFLSEGGYIDCLIFDEDMKTMIDHFTQLTGKPAAPPIFAFGYSQSRWGYKTQDEVETIIDKFDEYELPLDIFWLDVDHLKGSAPFEFNHETFPDPDKLIKKLADNKRYLVRLCDIHLPTWEDHKVYQEAKSKDYFVKNIDGSDFVGNCWPGKSSYLDLLDEDVRSWYSTQFYYNNIPDVTAPNVFFWNDMNEPSVFEQMEGTFPKHVQHRNKIEVRETHNLYGILNHASTYEGLINRNEDKNSRPFILTRSFFAGSQKFSWTWTGDNYADWGVLKRSLSVHMNMGLNGFPFTGSDVGGFTGDPSGELLVRWFQLAAFTYPFFREHCYYGSEYREPYLFEGEIFNCLQEAMYKRYRLLALWYTAGMMANRTGISPIVPMFVEWPEIDEMHDVTHQVLLAESILVAPVLEENVTEVDVIMPPGVWYDFYTGILQNKTSSVNVSLMDTPAFMRGGKIIPLYLLDSAPTNTRNVLPRPITLLVALDENNESEGIIYLDDGLSFNFQKGEFIFRKFTLKNMTITSRRVENETSVPDVLNNSIIEQIIVYGIDDRPVIFQNSFNLCEDWDFQVFFMKNSHNEKRSNAPIYILIASICVLIGITLIILIIKRNMKKKQDQYEEINKH